MHQIISEENAKSLESGQATIKINPNGNGNLSLFVNGQIVHTGDGTYSECCEVLIKYMNSY